MSGTRYAQFCALARAAEILGERWALLIIRELLLGQKRFGDLSDRLSGVSPTVLTTRLKKLPLDQAIGEKSATVAGSLRIARMLPRYFDRSEKFG